MSKWTTNNTLYSGEIEKHLASYPDFVGVFPRNRLPRKVKRPCGGIINLDNHDEPGSHWVAFFLDDGCFTEYFDPLGSYPVFKEIKSFLKKYSPLGISFNNLPLQGDKSTSCGHFCIYFLQNRFKGHSFCQVLSDLSLNNIVNDFIVKQIN